MFVPYICLWPVFESSFIRLWVIKRYIIITAIHVYQERQFKTAENTDTHT
uniref:Uncharacterized protein n=1 Tax=Anopheles minimus TaxID=112268 RepID=A0A182WPI0_9DIPT